MPMIPLPPEPIMNLLIVSTDPGWSSRLESNIQNSLPAVLIKHTGDLTQALAENPKYEINAVLIDDRNFELPSVATLSALPPLLVLGESLDPALVQEAKVLGTHGGADNEGVQPTGSVNSLGRVLEGIRSAMILRRSEDLARRTTAIKNLVLDNSTLGLAFIHDRKFEWVNSRLAEIVGRPLDEIMGSTTRILYPDDSSYEEMGRTVYPAMERGDRSDVVWQLTRGDGSIFWCRMIGRPLDSLRPHDGTVWMMEDITEKVRADHERLSLEVQLRHAQKLEAVGQLAAGIAHEINTPTQFIGDNLLFISDAVRDVFKALAVAQEAGAKSDAFTKVCGEVDLDFLQDEIPKAIEQSLEGIGRVAKIVKAMRDFSHPGNDLCEEVDLNRSIESTITVSRNEWKYVAQLTTDFDPGLPPVKCFPNEINQAVLNLIVNASHAIGDVIGNSGGQGLITISTHVSGEMAEIRVGDSGGGIPEHVQGRIFDPFFTTKAVGKGTGQGLAIVHNVIVDRHSGSVTFETEPGKGTTFILRIPISGPKASMKGPGNPAPGGH